MTLPALYTITPSQGFAGTAISGRGTNFGVGDTALVNGQSVPATFPGPGQVSLAVPSTHAAGFATVAIRRAVDGVVSNPVNFSVLPSISAVNIAPAVGKVPMLGNPGSTVLITADGLVDGATVTFGVDKPVPLRAAAVWSPPGVTFPVPPKTYSAVVPPTAASGKLTVTLPSGQVVGQFNYPIDNFRNSSGLSWDNTGQFQSVAGDLFSYADATALFGAGQTQVDVLGVNVAGPFVNLFISLANAYLDAGGQCFGMSLSSIQFASGEEPYGNNPLQPVGAGTERAASAKCVAVERTSDGKRASGIAGACILRSPAALGADEPGVPQQFPLVPPECFDGGATEKLSGAMFRPGGGRYYLHGS